jgi:hypothetical protein
MIGLGIRKSTIIYAFLWVLSLVAFSVPWYIVGGNTVTSADTYRQSIVVSCLIEKCSSKAIRPLAGPAQKIKLTESKI